MHALAGCRGAASPLRPLLLVAARAAQMHISVMTMDVQFGVVPPGHVPAGGDCRFHGWKPLGLDIEAAELQCPTMFRGKNTNDSRLHNDLPRVTATDGGRCRFAVEMQSSFP